VRKKIRGFTLIELLVVIAIIALLISILLPSLSRARELSKRLVCMSNIKGFGTSCKIYANDNSDSWPVPPFDKGLLSNDDMVDYTQAQHTTFAESHAGQVGLDRGEESYSFGGDASTQVSVTRAFWMLVRTGDITVAQFVCPSSSDKPDDTENINDYYDFKDYENISYGYQVPFGPRDTAPREGMDNRQAVSADKGPFYLQITDPPWENAKGDPLSLDDSPKEWKLYNSPNHGGRGSGEGQNVLYADGHASFGNTPTVGIDSDNIYTSMEEVAWDTFPQNIIHGAVPAGVQPPPYPGLKAMGSDFQLDYSSTDTLIYP
jgi:prepilin-type N-terminal cleavage/methylation domain-containing protein/prepilin-type processing-associated H-X9-DG protein